MASTYSTAAGTPPGPKSGPSPPDISSFPTPLHACYPQPMDSRKSTEQYVQRRRPGAPLGSQNARHPHANLQRHSRPRSGIEGRSGGPQQSGQKSSHPCQHFELFPIFLIFWAPFSLAALYIMLKQFPSQARRQPAVNRHMTVFSCLTCRFTTYQNRLMSSCQPSASPQPRSARSPTAPPRVRLRAGRTLP